MDSQVPTRQICVVCSKKTQEIVSILDSFERKLVSMNQTVRDSEIRYSEQTANYTNFFGYIEMIFGRLLEKEKSQTSCQHLDLKSQFSHKIKISRSRLDSLCNILAWKRAKYSFHMDMLIEQVKTFPNIVLKVSGQNYSSERMEEEEIETHARQDTTKEGRNTKQSSHASTIKSPSFQQQLLEIKQKLSSINKTAQENIRKQENSIPERTSLYTRKL